MTEDGDFGCCLMFQSSSINYSNESEGDEAQKLMLKEWVERKGHQGIHYNDAVTIHLNISPGIISIQAKDAKKAGKDKQISFYCTILDNYSTERIVK